MRLINVTGPQARSHECHGWLTQSTPGTVTTPVATIVTVYLGETNYGATTGTVVLPGQSQTRGDIALIGVTAPLGAQGYIYIYVDGLLVGLVQLDSAAGGDGTRQALRSRCEVMADLRARPSAGAVRCNWLRPAAAGRATR
jgi:hypothetical protein